LSKLGHGRFIHLGVAILTGACTLAASVALLPTLPRSGDLVTFDAGYLAANALIDDSQRAP
jgi:hypothetical protein